MIKPGKEIINQLEKYFGQKAEDLGISLAFLFGSYARGFIKAESDLDLAVVYAGEMAEEEVFKAITDLAFELSLLLKIEVNVVPIFRDFRKPMLYYNAIVLGTPVFIKNRIEYIKLYLDALFNMEDFTIFGTRWQLAVASKNLGG